MQGVDSQGREGRGHRKGAVGTQGWEPGGNPSHNPRKGRLTGAGRGKAPAEAEVGEGQQPRTLGRKKPNPGGGPESRGVGRTSAPGPPSCREARVRSVPQPGPDEEGLQSPREPCFMTASRGLSRAWRRELLGAGLHPRGCFWSAGRAIPAGSPTLAVSPVASGSAERAVSAAPGPAHTSRRSGW